MITGDYEQVHLLLAENLIDCDLEELYIYVFQVEEFAKELKLMNSHPGNFGNLNSLPELTDPKKIEFNIKKIEKQYQKSKNFDELDNRLFLYEKFQPVEEEQPNIPIFQNKEESDLDLESPLEEHLQLNDQNSPSENVKNDGIKINYPYFIKCTPYSKHSPTSNQVTKRLQIYEWIKQIANIPEANSTMDLFLPKSRQINKNYSQVKAELIPNFIKMVNEDQNPSVSESSCFQSIKVKDVNNLFLKLIDGIQLYEDQRAKTKGDFSKILESQEFQFASLSGAMCIIYMGHFQAEMEQFIKIMKVCHTTPFDFWKMLQVLFKLNFVPFMPSPLKLYLREIDSQLLFQYAWEKDSSLISIVNTILLEQQSTTVLNTFETPLPKIIETQRNSSFENLLKEKRVPHLNLNKRSQAIFSAAESQQSRKGCPENLFFKRILHKCAERIVEITGKIELKGDPKDLLNSELKEKIWKCTIYCLSHEHQLLIGRNVNHIILCSIYALCKLAKLNVTFNDIIRIYMDTYSLAIEDMHQIIYQINMSDPTEENKESYDKKDIIHFYNIKFLETAKKFVMSLNNPNHKLEWKKAHIPALFPDTSLKENIPPSLYNFTTIFKSGPTFKHFKDKRIKEEIVKGKINKTIYSFGKSPSSVLHAINNSMKKSYSGKKLIFETQKAHNHFRTFYENDLEESNQSPNAKK